MTDIKKLKHGTSLCFFGRIDEMVLAETAKNRIDCVELSFGEHYYEEIDLSVNSKKYADMAKNAGVELWSLHLPFSRKLDISITDPEMRSYILSLNEKLIRAAGETGIKVAVLHPSSEPISDEERPERMKLSRDGIEKLAAVCEQSGVKLAVENLPRTCLCTHGPEMVTLLSGLEDVGVCFDTNHSLYEDNLDYLRTLKNGGLKIRTLHISDYDGIDERHRLPGDGINRWHELLAFLMEKDYDGPLMYEVPHQPKEREPIPTETLAKNMFDLSDGLIK